MMHLRVYSRLQIETELCLDSITTTEEACEGEYLKIKCKRPYHVEIKEAAYGVWSNSNKCGAKYDEYGDCIAPNSMEVRL